MPFPFPYLEIVGDHAQIGSAIGETFRLQIQKALSSARSYLPDYPRLITLSRSYLSQADTYFPHLVVELRAMAASANVGFQELFLANCTEVHPQSHHDHCTTILSFDGNQPIVGHNEDSHPTQIDELYILKATINGTTFLGLNYAPELPGTSASLNSHRLLQCINSLHPRPTLGVPKNFLARALLEASTLDQARSILSSTPHASGFNHFLVQGNHLLDIAVSPDTLEVDDFISTPFVHSNHYLTPSGKSCEAFRTLSSLERYQTAISRVRGSMNQIDMINLLRELDHTKFTSDGMHTNASVILYPERGEILASRRVATESSLTPFSL